MRVPHWVMATLVMCGLHLLWLIWLVPLPSFLRAPPRKPLHISILTGALDGQENGGNPNSDARVLWSPILLSLPTPMGFSGAVVSENLDVRPALNAPSGRPWLLERDDYGSTATDLARIGLVLDLTEPEGRIPLPVAASSPPPVEPGLTIETMDRPAGPRLVHTPWPEEEGTAGADISWGLTARLDIAPSGSVRAAMIEGPAADPAVNRLAARTLKRWRAEPTASGGIVRVALGHVVPPPAATPVEDWTP